MRDLLREIQICTIYRHFKGKLYYVVGLAEHSETHETMVIYHALYGDHEQWVRPLEMFLEEVPDAPEGVDPEEYNPMGQTYRFEPFLNSDNE